MRRTRQLKSIRCTSEVPLRDQTWRHVISFPRNASRQGGRSRQCQRANAVDHRSVCGVGFAPPVPAMTTSEFVPALLPAAHSTLAHVEVRVRFPSGSTEPLSALNCFQLTPVFRIPNIRGCAIAHGHRPRGVIPIGGRIPPANQNDPITSGCNAGQHSGGPLGSQGTVGPIDAVCDDQMSLNVCE